MLNTELGKIESSIARLAPNRAEIIAELNASSMKFKDDLLMLVGGLPDPMLQTYADVLMWLAGNRLLPKAMNVERHFGEDTESPGRFACIVSFDLDMASVVAEGIYKTINKHFPAPPALSELEQKFVAAVKSLGYTVEGQGHKSGSNFCDVSYCDNDDDVFHYRVQFSGKGVVNDCGANAIITDQQSLDNVISRLEKYKKAADAFS